MTVGRRRKEIPASAVKRALDGEHVADLAAEFGMSPTTFTKRLKDAGVVRGPGGPRLSLPDEDILKYYLNGRPLARIAEVMGVSISAIRARLKKQGVERVFEDPTKRVPPRTDEECTRVTDQHVFTVAWAWGNSGKFDMPKDAEASNQVGVTIQDSSQNRQPVRPARNEAGEITR